MKVNSLKYKYIFLNQYKVFLGGNFEMNKISKLTMNLQKKEEMRFELF